MARRADVMAIIVDLLESREPVSFHDAVMLVRQLPREPEDTVLHALVLLHDSDNATDGARAVLSDCLRAAATRIEHQRRRAQRPLTLADDGKSVRVRLGQTLTLHLDERRGAGFRWHPPALRGGRITRAPQSQQGPRAVLVVEPARAGTLRLAFEERPPPAGASPGEDPRSFTLTLIVEPPAEA